MQKPKPQSPQQLIPVETIDRRIFLIRSQRVMLDQDLAQFSSVSQSCASTSQSGATQPLPGRLPFVMKQEGFANLKLHFAASSSGWGGRGKLPYAFTEHGAVMAANVDNSPVEVSASFQVVRAFVWLREILATHKDLARKLEEME